MTQGVSPEKVALTLAVGGVLALFPVPGTTTILCLLAGIALGLNQVIIQAVNGLCALIWVPAQIGFVRLGQAITRAPETAIHLRQMGELLRRHPAEFFRQFGATGVHALMGWAIVAPLLIPLAYFAARPALRAAARRIEQASRPGN